MGRFATLCFLPLIRHILEATSETELDRAAFNRLRERHPQRLKALIMEDARALGLIITDKADWESLGQFCARLGISAETFHRRRMRPCQPAGFEVEQSARTGRVLRVRSNGIADKFFRCGRKAAQITKFPAL